MAAGAGETRSLRGGDDDNDGGAHFSALPRAPRAPGRLIGAGDVTHFRATQEVSSSSSIPPFQSPPLSWDLVPFYDRFRGDAATISAWKSEQGSNMHNTKVGGKSSELNASALSFLSHPLIKNVSRGSFGGSLEKLKIVFLKKNILSIL
jgi:hypothetical protein